MGPLSADEVRMSLGHRKIGQATVYRLLRQGVEEGHFKEVHFPDGPNRYELTKEGHHHYFLCNECDRAFDLEGCVEQVNKLAPKGFRVEEHDILLHGQCSECKEESR